MAKHKIPMTPALRVLDAAGLPYQPCEYDYVEKGGTAHSSACLGVPEHQVIKTLCMETETRAPLLVLMHGDCSVSTKQLARVLQVKSVEPCDPAVAQRHTGYQVGGTSPFGTRKPIPLLVERSIMDLPEIHINGGRRGLLVKIAPAALNILSPRLVDVAQ